MALRIGSGYIGSSNIETSTANHEVVPVKPSDWTHGYNFYKFSFRNDQACSVLINNQNTIYLRADQGFEMNEIDWPIHSFKIINSGINYNFVAAY